MRRQVWKKKILHLMIAFWYVMESSGGFSATQWGSKDDIITPGDYDGDGKTDRAVYRPNPLLFPVPGENTNWYIDLSSSGTFLTTTFGNTGGGFNFDSPAPADYDGDGKTDLALYTKEDYNSPSYFKILQSSNNSKVFQQWGSSFDRIIPADYDGDGKTDLAVFRTYTPSAPNDNNIWYILQSSNGAMRIERFGLREDKLVSADYDGDGKADLAVWRPSNGFWYIKNSNGAANDSFTSVQFGAAGDRPVPADYDGDGKTDIAVFRPSNGMWYLLKSTEGFAAQQFGLSDDIPVSGGDNIPTLIATR